MRKQCRSILVLMKDAVVRLFSDAEWTDELILDRKGMAEIQTVVSRSVTKAFQSSSFQTIVGIAIHKCLAEQNVANDV